MVAAVAVAVAFGGPAAAAASGRLNRDVCGRGVLPHAHTSGSKAPVAKMGIGSTHQGFDCECA